MKKVSRFESLKVSRRTFRNLETFATLSLETLKP